MLEKGPAQIHSRMAGDAHRVDPADATDSLVRLARLAHAEAGGSRLTPTQWMVLRYFARANRFSRTVSAFAQYHASTRGTASQTIKGLVQRGYLTRAKSETDGRSVRLDVTERGRAVLAADPCARLESVIATLPSTELSAFERRIRTVTDSLGAALQRPAFGTCRGGCRFLEAAGDMPSVAERPVCLRLGTQLELSELGGLCMVFASE